MSSLCRLEEPHAPHRRTGPIAACTFSDSTAALERAILNKPTTGETALYDAIALGLAQLQAASHDKKVLIVVSDGGDNASRQKLCGVRDRGRHDSFDYHADERDQTEFRGCDAGPFDG